MRVPRLGVRLSRPQRHEDLFIVNGHVFPAATQSTMLSAYERAPLLLRRDGPRFTPVTAAEAGPWLDVTHCDRTAVFGDLDGDGDVDVITAGLAEPCACCETTGPLVTGSSSSPPNPRGAAASRSRRRANLAAWIVSGAGYLSASTPSRTSAWVRVTPPSTFAWSGPTEPAREAAARRPSRARRAVTR